jgi:hypothetical protein
MSKQLVIEHVWPKTITVDKRIVRILSASTYDNFPNALKELITNSYDADSSFVDIKIDVKNETITLSDDGSGMSEADFTLYLRIAGSRREKKPKTPSGRAVIGQFGVGFLSVFPFFKNYAIETKKAGSDEVLRAEIPCDMYFGSNTLDISEIKVHGGIKHDRSKIGNHYTKITLSGFTGLSKAFFFPNRQVKHQRYSILRKSSIEVLEWRLSEDLPLKYKDEKFNKLFDKYSPNMPFKVKLNGDELLRRTYGKEILEINKGDHEQIGKIKFRYFFVTDRLPIKEPSEGRSIKIRNHNVGVGDRTTFGLGSEMGGSRSRLHWLSGEIHIVEGMNDLITVSRDKFNYDPDYENLKDFFIKKLLFHSNQLEQEEELKNYVGDSQDESKVKNIKLLGKSNITKKITKLKRGKEEKEYVTQKIRENSKGDPDNGERVQYKHLELPENEIEFFEKKLRIDGRAYKVVLEAWDYKKEFHPACKIAKGNLYINESYPLFKKPKHTDIFIKLHVLLLKHLENGNISKNVYSQMSDDILTFYYDYK